MDCGFVRNQHSDQLSVGLLAQLVLGRTLHRYLSVRGLNSRTGPNFFSGPILTAAQVVFIIAKIAFLFIPDLLVR